jgi:hypothetical protein
MFAYCHAQNAANARIGKWHQKYRFLSTSYRKFAGLFGIAAAKWRWTPALRGDVLFSIVPLRLLARGAFGEALYTAAGEQLSVRR